MSVYANFEPWEGNLNNGERAISFNLKSRKLQISNDSGANDLQYKFKEGATFGTLKPAESLNLDFQTKTVYLKTTASVDYRVWSWG